jgi:hypothetical protein
MALLTLTDYKLAKGITDDTDDDRIQKLIEIVEAEIRGICRYDDDEDLPASLEGIAVEMVDTKLQSQAAFKSQSFEGNSVTYAEGYSKRVMDALYNCRRIGYV